MTTAKKGRHKIDGKLWASLAAVRGTASFGLAPAGTGSVVTGSVRRQTYRVQRQCIVAFCPIPC